jgi:thioesterase domain-containing protein/NAD(P)-dependent dehydrogenase (short-subunit alcohol dehydrogenase family)/acyl carrier protein
MQQVAGEPVRDPARAVLLGVSRVIPKELPGIACRSIDIDLESGKGLGCAGQIILEMDAIRENATVAYRRGERFVETVEPFNLTAAPERRRLERGGVYLITGGLGGLGLVVAEQLAREFNARLVLVGRSALPPESQWEVALKGDCLTQAQTIQKLMEIRSDASGLVVAQADVTNLNQMRDAIGMARKKFGRIDGVFHAAGVLDDGPLMLKTAQSAARVLDPKVRGTLVLEEALGDTPLSCFVLFSSISSIASPAGQVDYAAANAFLDAFALSRKQQPITVVNWGLWREVGMGARSVSPHPWLDERLLDSPEEIVYAGQFSQSRRWVLSEHKFKSGIALIPGTGYLEMVAGAFTRGSQQGAVEFQNVFFLAPFMVNGAESKEVRVQFRREQDAGADKGAFRFSVFGQSGEWVEQCTGTIAPCRLQLPARVDRAAIAARCRDGVIVFDDENRTRQERQFDFGRRWRSLRKLHMGKGEGLAEIELDQNLFGDVDDLRQHPALLDMATGAALYLTEDYENSDDLFLPITYRSMRAYRPFPARLYSHIRSRQENGVRSEVETWDITIFDEQGEVVAEIDGFAMRRIADPAKIMAGQLQGPNAVRAHGERLIEIAERPGIGPVEGARALTRILLAETPTAVVAVAQLPEELEPHKATPSPKPQTVAVSVVSAAAAAPASESVEGTLISWWQELLGVDEIGLDDDFFALGGHSLVGVRLFAKIKKTWAVGLELAVLFEARTVRQLGELIRKAQQPVAVVEPKTWSCLVPIQPKGRRTPLFCVHAIGGDVIFYEQLARALGPDQPFYAFRSPLVTEENKRETTNEELAATYVKELREFYPQGPYLLGGASYGGLIIFEMAKQLHAQGVEPGLIIMFDTAVPGNEEILETTVKVSAFWENLRNGGLAYFKRKMKEKSRYWGDKVHRRADMLACSALRLAGLRLPAALRYIEMEEIHKRALEHYVFQPYPGKITLARAIDRGPEVLGKREDPTLGWGKLAAGGLNVFDVPTKHMYMLFDPYVATFAKLLETILPASKETTLQRS